MRPIFVIALTLLTLAACGPVTITPDSMRGQCWSQSNPDCFELCDQYRDLVNEGKFANKVQCRQACTEVFRRQYADNAINRCDRSAGNGMDLCNQYCNTNYPD